MITIVFLYICTFPRWNVIGLKSAHLSRSSFLSIPFPRIGFPFHSFWILQIFSQYSSFLVWSSRLGIFTNSSWMALEYSLFTAVLLNVRSPALDTQGCVTSGLTPTCSYPARRDCVTPQFRTDCSRELNHSSCTWTFQTIHLCSHMTTLHSVPSGLSVLFVLMHVYTMIKSNKIFLATWISNQSSIISSNYPWNGRLINHKITPAQHCVEYLHRATPVSNSDSTLTYPSLSIVINPSPDRQLPLVDGCPLAGISEVRDYWGHCVPFCFFKEEAITPISLLDF